MTRATAMERRRLTAWATAQPKFHPVVRKQENKWKTTNIGKY
jgi:hypothetical protein